MFSKRFLPLICCNRGQLVISFNQYLLFSTGPVTSSTFKSLKNTKKKLTNPVVFKKKNVDSPLVEIKNNLTVDELALLLNRSHDSIFEALSYVQGAEKYQQVDQVIDDLPVIKQVVARCGYRFRVISSAVKPSNDKQHAPPKHEGPRQGRMRPRAPVVTIMGHVDHGKTTLLDALRHSNVVAQEFGGITQHIGAFSVRLDKEPSLSEPSSSEPSSSEPSSSEPSSSEPSSSEPSSSEPSSSASSSSERSITFLDTPGHAAFSAMRQRGASLTDLVVLVVAADDGVMRQTEECIQFAKKACVPLIVAINKCDKANADIEGTMRGLLQHGVQLEQMGGDVQSVNVSALKGDNLESLKECIVAQAEVMQLQADEECHVEAVCVESSVHQDRGKLATVLLQHGTLKKGAVLVAGKAWAKVRAMFDDRGMPVQKAVPGCAVQVLGWRALPPAGQVIIQVSDEAEAKRLVGMEEERQTQERVQADEEAIQLKMMQHQEVYKEERMKRLEKGLRISKIRKARTKESEAADDSPRLALVLKGDVDGSVEAILDVLDTYQSPQCRMELLSYGVGAVSENDVEVASLFDGIIYSFNVATPVSVMKLAKQQGVNIVDFNIIYRLLAHLRDQLNQRLKPVTEEQIVGEANVLASFVVTEGRRKVSVAGCRCSKGFLHKKMAFKLLRQGEVLLQGGLQSLKHHKNEVESVKTDVECGLSFSDQSHQPQAGDLVVCYEKVTKKQSIDWDLEFL